MIETYTFTHGLTVYTYTSEDDAISRGSIKSTLESTGSRLQIEVPRDNAVALLYRHTAPVTRVTISVTTGAQQVWSGFVSGARWHGSGVTIECADILAQSTKLMIPQRFNRNCRHVLYSPECGVLKNHRVMIGSISDIDTSKRTVRFESFLANAMHAEGVGGVLVQGGREYQVLGYVQISAKVGTYLLMSMDDNLGDGEATRLAGCDHTYAMCESRFDNIKNFGGLRIPAKNPFREDYT